MILKNVGMLVYIGNILKAEGVFKADFFLYFFCEKELLLSDNSDFFAFIQDIKASCNQR